MKWKAVVVGLALFLSVALNVSAAWQLLRIDELMFPYGGSGAISMFNGNPEDGSLVITGKIPEQRTALDFWPFNGALPLRHALTEIALYRTRFMDWPNFERMSISAMASTLRFGPHYRVSIENGGAGQSLPLIFCFDGQDVGSQSYCPLRIDPIQGVIICDQNDICKKVE